MAVNLGSTFKELIDEINSKATQEYVNDQIGNIDTLLTALNSGTGV